MKMKKILPFLLMLLWFSGARAIIVNNSTTSPTSEDSLSFVFYSLDSLGNSTTADSLFILVSSPTGTIAFKDSMAIGDGRITSTTIRGKQFYSFSDQVSNLDGTGVEGAYSISLLAFKSSYDLLTANNYSFQITAEELSDQLSLIGDSVIVKGGLIDSTILARTVWNTPQSGHTVSGSFGKFLDTEVSGISSGSGAYSYTLHLYDSLLDQSVSGISVAIRNLTQTALIAVGGSNSSGILNVNLDADSFMVTASGPGYTFAAYDTVIVTGAGFDTLYGYSFDPGNPATLVFCRVYGFLYLPNGVVEQGVTVTASLPGGVVRYSNLIISPFLVSTTTDSVGYFFLDLIRSNLLIPAATKYEISISRKDGTIMRKRFVIPDSPNWMITW